MAYRVHLDYATNAPLIPEAKNSMIQAMELASFDARRLYDDAIEIRYNIETAREKIAIFFGCDPFEVIFTSSHSEALATFAFGVIESKTNSNSNEQGTPFKKNVVGTEYDSEVILETWSREDIQVRTILGNEKGTLEISDLEAIVDENTSAVTLPFAHPDTGTLQDIEQIVSKVQRINPQCLIHVDARLGAGYKKINFSELGIGAMSIDPVAFGGPSGIGALLLSRKFHLSPLLTGSTQERARRSGQENYIGIAGFASACEITSMNMETTSSQSSKFKEIIIKGLEAAGAKLLLNTFQDQDAKPTHLNNVVAAYFPSVAASAVVAEFNRLGINVHAGSSCGSEEFEPSRQLKPLTKNNDLSESVFRMSWGWNTKQSDVELFITELKQLPYSN